MNHPVADLGEGEGPCSCEIKIIVKIAAEGGHTHFMFPGNSPAWPLDYLCLDVFLLQLKLVMFESVNNVPTFILFGDSFYFD